MTTLLEVCKLLIIGGSVCLVIYFMAYIAAKQAIKESYLADKMDVHDLHSHIDNIQNLVDGLVVKKLSKRKRKE